ncbi:hypothetical protein ACFE04_024273 [Oxalis oulophora]
MEDTEKNKNLKKTLLILNAAMLALGNCGGPLIMRLYFLKGGKGVWMSSFLETAGWPLNLIPIVISYSYRRKKDPAAKFFSVKPRLFLACAVIGILTGLDDFIYAYGVARLPISTSALVIATQLAFTAGFAFLLVKQKFTSYMINAVFLLTIGAGVLALHTSSDRPAGESKKEYFMGFFMTLGAAALYGFILPAVEYTYKKAKQRITYPLVLEMQMYISFFATAFCFIGMLAQKEFQTIPKEGRDFQLGETKYYIVLTFSAILWQFFFLGAVGVIFCASSLLSGIIIAVLLPVTESLAVLFYHEKFQVEKVVSLILSLWGFVSYFYGEIQENKKMKRQVPVLEEEDSSSQIRAAVP